MSTPDAPGGPTGPPASDSAGSQAGPVCPRHPDRLAYVRCQRCDRPVCPECQRPASVGVQCVDCVAQAAREAPRPVSRFGAAASADRRPLVTFTIIGLCLLVYVAQLASPQVTREMAFYPLFAGSEPWRFITAAFVHSPGSILHIAFNMYALFIIGGYLEPLIGRVRFVALYLISAFGGGVGLVLLAQLPNGWVTPTVGASGAVFGLFAAVLVLHLHLGRQTGGILVLLVINGVLGFVIPNIAWQAHLGGAVTGAALAGVLALTAAPGREAAAVRRRALVWPGFAFVLVVLVALTWWRVASVEAVLFG